MNAAHSRIIGLDALRAYAILLVLILHTIQLPQTGGGVLRDFFSMGWIGVDLFFVLSGFLIGSQLHALTSWNFSEVKKFWIRRWTRTLPLYYLVLLVYLVVKPSLFQAPFQGETWKFFLFWQNYSPIRDFAQSWSLCIEEQFYFFIPFFFLVGLARSGWIWLSILILSPIMRGLVAYELDYPWFSLGQVAAEEFDYQIRFLTHLHLDGFAFGLILSSKDHWREWRIPKFSGIIVAIALAFATWKIGYSPKSIFLVSLYPSILSFGFSLLLICSFQWKIPTWLHYPIQQIAMVSYGAYLWNNLLLRVFHRYSLPGNWLMYSVAFIFGTLILAKITYHLIEKPGLQLRRLQKE